jgi:Ras-related protein Rab-7A
MAMDDSEPRPIKVILVGSSGVGKTSLINNYFDQPHETDTSPTVAPALVATTISIPSGQPVDLHIWDTAGQERFQSIGGMFYRESDVALVCFDQ